MYPDAKTLDDPSRMKFPNDEFYIKSREEMEGLFTFAPQAIDNTLKIAKRCNVEFDFDSYHIPTFDVPQGYTALTYLSIYVTKAWLKGTEMRMVMLTRP